MTETNTTAIEPTAADLRNTKIGMMLQVLNNVMDECEREQIDFDDMISAVTHLWGMRNNKSSYSCGQRPDTESTNVPAEKVFAAIA